MPIVGEGSSDWSTRTLVRWVGWVTALIPKRWLWNPGRSGRWVGTHRLLLVGVVLAYRSYLLNLSRPRMSERSPRDQVHCRRNRSTYFISSPGDGGEDGGDATTIKTKILQQFNYHWVFLWRTNEYFFNQWEQVGGDIYWYLQHFSCNHIKAIISQTETNSHYEGIHRLVLVAASNS